MTEVARVFKYIAFGLMALFGLLGGLFVVGETFADPGGWAAVGMSLLWVVPMIGLSAFAALRPERSARLLVALTAVVAALTLADAALGIVPRDQWGPVTAVLVFALGVVLAFLGLHRAALAGLLMLVAAGAQLAATVTALAVHAGGGPGMGALLGGSSGVVVMPLVVVGVMFLVAAALAHEPLAPGRMPPVPSAR